MWYGIFLESKENSEENFVGNFISNQRIIFLIQDILLWQMFLIQNGIFASQEKHFWLKKVRFIFKLIFSSQGKLSWFKEVHFIFESIFLTQGKYSGLKKVHTLYSNRFSLVELWYFWFKNLFSSQNYLFLSQKKFSFSIKKWMNNNFLDFNKITIQYI